MEEERRGRREEGKGEEKIWKKGKEGEEKVEERKRWKKGKEKRMKIWNKREGE